jgi:hypothetical protein
MRYLTPDEVLNRLPKSGIPAIEEEMRQWMAEFEKAGLAVVGRYDLVEPAVWCDSHMSYECPTPNNHPYTREGDPPTWPPLRVHPAPPEPEFYPGPVVDDAPTWGASFDTVPHEGYEVSGHLGGWASLDDVIEDWPPSRWVQVRRTPKPAEPATERVPWWEAVGRMTPDHQEVVQVTDNRGHISVGVSLANGSAGYDDADPDGTVEVLVEDGETET